MFFWLAGIVGVLGGVLLQAGRLSVEPGFRPFGAFVSIATVFVVWLGIRLKKVGYCGRELVVSNYLREQRIPFEQVECAEPVWWYSRRMVRVRFRSATSFGQTIYYIPKWAAFRCLWVAPEKELNELLQTNREPLRG